MWTYSLVMRWKKKLNKIKKLKEILNYCKYLGTEDPTYKMSSLILPGFKYLGTNFAITRNHEEKKILIN